METQVFMKDKLQELFGDCFGGAEKTRWAIAHQRIRRVCKAAQMIGYIYGSNEDTYKMLYRSIDGEITLEKIIDAVNVMIGIGHPKIDKTDTITMQSIRNYCRMNEPEFLAAFKEVEGYEYVV